MSLTACFESKPLIQYEFNLIRLISICSFSTIEVTSNMESKVAQAIEEILLRVQKVQNGEAFADVVAEM